MGRETKIYVLVYPELFHPQGLLVVLSPAEQKCWSWPSDSCFQQAGETELNGCEAWGTVWWESQLLPCHWSFQGCAEMMTLAPAFTAMAAPDFAGACEPWA